jgi:sugar phosphate isomerase/epimerase
MVLLETHGDFYTLERIQKVFDQVKSKNFRLLWDIGNTDVIYGDNFMEFYQPVKDLISHIHIKDFIRGTPGDGNSRKHCRIGHGQVPIKAIVNQMMADGYSGYYSLEWEKKWHPDLAEPEIAFPEFIQLMNDV